MKPPLNEPIVSLILISPLSPFAFNSALISATTSFDTILLPSSFKISVSSPSIFNDKIESLINLTNSLSFNLHNVSTLLENTSSITSCLAANFSFLALSLAPEITLSFLDLASISAFSKISFSSSFAEATFLERI